MFEPVTITRSASAVLDPGTGEGFWPDTIDTDKSATPTLAAKATPTEPGLAWGFIFRPKRSDKLRLHGLALGFTSQITAQRAADAALRLAERAISLRPPR